MKKFPKPSEFMRKRRPYLYSDSSKVGAYTLSRSEFSHFLDTLTDRNQHKDFETFCRHLCERILCPNLRTQTGPEGGGDGKVDTETYVVSDEVAQRWFVGDASARKERWGFAISTKKDWAPKVRRDVKGIFETGRDYHQIYFLTSRPVKSNRCRDVEQNLTSEYGIPVTILDREWIIERTIKNGFEDIAYHDLGAGRHDQSKPVVGSNDYRRNKQLAKVENRIKRLGNKQSDQTQLVSDTFEAARLSRELERPRIETEGRFKRAIDIAIRYGNHNQILRAKYEYAWTMLWWHDDIEPLNQTYDDIEEIVSNFDDAADFSKLCNLLHVLAARVLQGWETSDYLSLDARQKRLRSNLSKLSQDRSRPNNALYAETLLALSRLTDYETEGNAQALDEVWSTLANIVDRAEGLVEYPATMVDEVVEEFSSLVPESTALDSLAEKLAEFMGQRQKEGNAGKIYFRRGKLKLDAKLNIDAISWLGKASICFMKEEYREEQFETLNCLASAYHDAGLLWAARAVCLAALVQANAISAEEAETKIETIPTVSLLVLLSLQLGRIPDLMLCIYWMRGLLHTLPLNDTIKLRLDGEFQELDMLLSCFLAGVEGNSIAALSDLPDILEALALINSKITLVYRLGRANELKEHGLLPEGIDIAELADIVNAAASQPVSSELPKVPRLNDGQDFLAQTKTIGVLLEFSGDKTAEDILLCEGCMAAIESFLATAFSNKIFPKTEKLKVCIKIKDDLDEPEIIFDPTSMTLRLGWPKHCSVLDSNAVPSFGKYLLKFCIYTLEAIAFLPEAKYSLEHMKKKENLFERTVSFSFAHFFQIRILGNYFSTLDDLSFLVKKSYPPLEPLPIVVPLNLGEHKNDLREKDTENDKGLHSLRHNDIAVSSIINTHLWDKAGWRGVVYAHSGTVDRHPPVLGLFFENKEMALSIFNEWIDKFGQNDVHDRIRISIIRGINLDKVHHYRVHISPSIGAEGRVIEPSKMIWRISRLRTMEPDDPTNLEMFLKQFERFGKCSLVPAVSSGSGGKPELLSNYSILIRNLHVRQASEISANDLDVVAVGEDDKVIIPEATE